MVKALAVFLVLACGVALADERGQIVEKGKDRFETEFASGGRVQLDVRSGDVRISGSDSNKISIHYEGRHADDIPRTSSCIARRWGAAHGSRFRAVRGMSFRSG